MNEEIARILLEIKAVALKPSEPFRYASGILSPIYCDNRLLMSYVDHRRTVINALKDKAMSIGSPIDVIAGTATAGIPHAAWLADKMNKPMVYVRSSMKDHGKQNKIEGLVDENQNVIVVEDLVSTGGSSINTINALREKGAKVKHCLAIFTYNLPKAIKAFEEVDVKLHALTDFETMISVAENNNYITKEQGKIARDWNKAPELWGKLQGFEKDEGEK